MERIVNINIMLNNIEIKQIADEVTRLTMKLHESIKGNEHPQKRERKELDFVIRELAIINVKQAEIFEKLNKLSIK